MPRDHRRSKEDFPLAKAQRLYQDLGSYEKVAKEIEWSFAQTRRKLQAADSGEITFTDMPVETVDLTSPTPPPQVKKIKIADLCLTAGTQMREHSHDLFTVADYAEAMREGATFPPIIVFSDGVSYWLADGFQRAKAAQQLDHPDISADVRPGSLRDAVLHSCGANSQHGLRRTNADKRKAVRTLLSDDEWSQLSNHRIAEICGVTHPFVAEMRNPKDKVVTVTTRMNEDERNTSQDVGEHATGEHKAEQSVLSDNSDNGVRDTPLISIDDPPSRELFTEPESPSPCATCAAVVRLLDEAFEQLERAGYLDIDQTLLTVRRLVTEKTAVHDA